MSVDKNIWINGEEVIIEPDTTFWFECCDCSLVHLFLYRIDKDGNIAVRGYRDDAKTNEYRAEYTKKERREAVERFGGEIMGKKQGGK